MGLYWHLGDFLLCVEMETLQPKVNCYIKRDCFSCYRLLAYLFASHSI